MTVEYVWSGHSYHRKGRAVEFEPHKHKKDRRPNGSHHGPGQHVHGRMGMVSHDHTQRLLSPRADDGHVAAASHHADLADDFHPTHSKLHGKVLVLNGNYEPLAICSVEKAIVLLFLDKAELVSALQDRAIHSTSYIMPFPSVIRLSNYIRVPFKKVILSRKNILRRDGHKCQYCGATSVTLTVDHIIPKSRGGEDSWENLVSACLRCNNRKGSQTPDEAEMPLMKRPIRPNHVTFLRQYVGRIDKDWEPYLFMQ